MTTIQGDPALIQCKFPYRNIEDCLFVSPNGGEFCLKENLKREENCKAAESNSFDIRVGFSPCCPYYCLFWIIQFDKDTCFLNITNVQNTDFGTWTCHGNDFDTWVGGKVRAWQDDNIIIIIFNCLGQSP